MKIIVRILLSMICLACHPDKSSALQQAWAPCDTTKAWSFLKAYCFCDEDMDKNNNGTSSYRSTFERPTLVYCNPILTATVTDTLSPFTRFTILKQGTDPSSGTDWLQIAWQPSGRAESQQADTGYIQKENISLGFVSGNTPSGMLDFILGASPEQDTFNFGPKFRLTSILHKEEKQGMDASSIHHLDLDIGPVNYYNQYHLSAVYNHALKNMPNLLRLYWHHGESCPESEGSVFMISNKGKPELLTEASGTGEGGWYDYTRVYIPLMFDKDKILLVENGDRETMFNTWNATLNTIPYPKNCGIPITELVIVIEEEAQARTDKDGNYLLHKDGTEIMETLHKAIRYFQWDGQKLKQVKKIIIKEIDRTK